MKTTTKSKPTTRRSRFTMDGEDKVERIELKPIEIKEFNLKIKGVSPLIIHKFSEKSQKDIEDKQQKKGKQAKAARDPHAEFLAAHYVMPSSKKKAGEKGCRCGFPAIGFKCCAVRAATYVDGMTMTFCQGAFFVLEDEGGLVEIKGSEPKMRTDTVRLSGMSRVLSLTYRPEISDWSATLRIRYNSAAISAEQIVNLFNVGGFSVGVGDWRPQKQGSNGMFEVGT